MKRNKYAHIMQDVSCKFNEVMPYAVMQYRKTTQLLPYVKGCLVSGDLSVIGFYDSLGRRHMITRRNMRRLGKEYQAKFGNDLKNDL